MGASPGMPDGPVLCQPPPLPDASPTVEGGATDSEGNVLIPQGPGLGQNINWDYINKNLVD